MEDFTCNSSVCSEIIKISGTSIAATGVSEVVCNGQTYPIPQATVPSTVPQPGSESELNSTEIALLIALGALFVVVFVYWLYMYLRKKYSSK